MMTAIDRPWVDEVLAALGSRYKLGPLSSGGHELLFRAGKSEFRPSRVVLGTGGGRDVEISVDVRIPRDARSEAVTALIDTFETRSAKPRGFERTDDTTTEMTSELGTGSGVVRTLRYARRGATPAEAAKEIRALVETIDIPIIVGIHDPEHVVARDPPPPHVKKKHNLEPLDVWEYDLDRGLLKSLSLVVDPNDRTLRVFERKLLARTQLGEVVKLAHLAKLRLERRDGAAVVVGVRKDGGEVLLASGSGSADFRATLGRLARKVMIPLEER